MSIIEDEYEESEYCPHCGNELDEEYCPYCREYV